MSCPRCSPLGRDAAGTTQGVTEAAEPCNGAAAKLGGGRSPSSTVSGSAEELLRAGFAASTGAYRLSVLWKGIRNGKGAGDGERTGFI